MKLGGGDRTRLGRELARMEGADPEVAAARRALDRLADRATHPDDYVRAENLQVTDEDRQ